MEIKWSKNELGVFLLFFYGVAVDRWPEVGLMCIRKLWAALIDTHLQEVHILNLTAVSPEMLLNIKGGSAPPDVNKNIPFEKPCLDDSRSFWIFL